MKKEKVIVVVGPTATGKSDFAVSIAEAIGGEIISADSRQVYKGMDLGTGKITSREMRGIPHYLLDVENPKRSFSVSDFVAVAEAQITDIVSRKKVPIVCGGTGFYIDALIEGKILPDVSPNPVLRAKLAKKSVSELFSMLKKLDPRRARTIDPNNPVRLIRAIEIAKTLGTVPAITVSKKYTPLYIGLDMRDEVLHKRIHDRLLARIKKGMLKEATLLHKRGLSWKRMEELGLEYRYMARHLRETLTREEMLEELEEAIWHYVKRQRTWFKKHGDIVWLDPSKKTSLGKALSLSKKFLRA